MKLSKLTVALLAVVASTAAARAEGWTVGGFITPYTEAEDIEFGTALGPVTTTFEADMGFGGVVIGRDLGAWRIEGEWSTREFEVEDHRLGGAALPGPTGSLETQALFLNAVYRFLPEGSVSPYLGAGAGWVEAELDGFGVAPVPQVLSDDDSGFAYQAIAGVDFRLGERWGLFVDYRYLVADGLEVTVSPAAGAVSSEIDVEAQSLQAGFRIRF